jgi:hypothetical protein
LISSDLSPGGGERESWQKVAAPLCRERAQALGAALKSREISGVSVHVAYCSGQERDRVVSLDAPSPAPAGASATVEAPRIVVKTAQKPRVVFTLPE